MNNLDDCFYWKREISVDLFRINKYLIIIYSLGRGLLSESHNRSRLPVAIEVFMLTISSKVSNPTDELHSESITSTQKLVSAI